MKPGLLQTRTGNRFDLPDLREFDNFFQNFFGAPFNERANKQESWVPSVDISESEKEFTLTAELPGLDESGISIEVEGETLVLSGKKEQEKEDVSDNRVHWERSYGSFERRFTIPKSVDQESIRANFRNGVLTVKLEKRPEGQNGVKKIPIS